MNGFQNIVRTGAMALSAVLILSVAPQPAMARHDQNPNIYQNVERQVIEDLLRGRYVNSRGERVIYDNDDLRRRTHRRGRDIHDDDDLRRNPYRRSEFENLPPGIQKRVRQGKPIPPGIANKMTILPVSYNRYLGYPVNGNYRVGVLDRDLIIFNPLTQMILDVIRNDR